MILVTGGAGFIGANFVLEWLARFDEPVLNLDKLTYAGNLENLASVEGDARHVFVRTCALRMPHVHHWLGQQVPSRWLALTYNPAQPARLPLTSLPMLPIPLSRDPVSGGTECN